MSSTEISYIGPLADLTGLKFLYLLGTKVSDIGPLAGLAALETLDLRNAAVWELAVGELSDAPPECKILHNYQNRRASKNISRKF